MLPDMKSRPGSVIVRVAASVLVVAPLALGIFYWADDGTRSIYGANTPIQVPGEAGGKKATRYLIVGGGSLPESNEVQIEQDVLLAEELLGDAGLTLFAGGRGANGVQVLGRVRQPDSLRAELAQLFAPRRGRDSTYRKTRVTADAPARKSEVLKYLRQELSSPELNPLLVFIAGHGDRGEQPKESMAVLWGQGTISVSEYVAELDKKSTKPVTTIVTGCFSGGFAELVFTGADPAKGVSVQDRCGLFSTMWNLEASGCDPNPDRRAQYGYGIYFLNALRSRNRDGQLVPRETFDVDGDGDISYLEAHSYVRIASLGLDVPTSTSERWLRYVGPAEDVAVTVSMPEENAVVQALGTRLGLPAVDSEEAAITRFQAFQEAIEDLSSRLETEKAAVDTAYFQLLGEILAVWPVLDDPWHPDFARTLETQRRAIRRWLDTSLAYASYLRALQVYDALDQQLQQARIASAPLERYLRAAENIRLAGRLRARGGPEWAIYERLVNCERGVP